VASRAIRLRATRLRKPSYGRTQVADHLQLACWQFDAGRALGLIPPADAPAGEWSAALVEQLQARRPELVDAVGRQIPIGAQRDAPVTSNSTVTLIGRGRP
jgi:hypothetical protein